MEDSDWIFIFEYPVDHQLREQPTERWSETTELIVGGFILLVATITIKNLFF